MKTTKTTTIHLTFSALLLALALFLPFLTGQIPEIGRMLSPLHIPAMLAGFVLPLPWAVPLAFAMPLVRSLIFSSPPMLPMAITMAFELATYALVISILAKRLAKSFTGIILTLIAAMVVGRLVYAIAFYIVMLAMGNPFNLQAVITGLTVEGLPGIIVQLVLIPPIVLALRSAGYTSLTEKA